MLERLVGLHPAAAAGLVNDELARLPRRRGAGVLGSGGKGESAGAVDGSPTKAKSPGVRGRKTTNASSARRTPKDAVKREAERVTRKWTSSRARLRHRQRRPPNVVRMDRRRERAQRSASLRRPRAWPRSKRRLMRVRVMSRTLGAGGRGGATRRHVDMLESAPVPWGGECERSESGRVADSCGGAKACIVFIST